MSESSSRNREAKSIDVLSIGLDPGGTTGVALLKGNLSNKYSSGEWDTHLIQYSMDELGAHGEETFSLPVLLDWWGRTSAAGTGLAMLVFEMVCQELDGRIEPPSGGSLRIIVTMEDFIMRPAAGAAGGGGRDIVSPVAIGAAFQAQFRQLQQENWKLQISSPSAKSVMDNEKLRRWFGEKTGVGKPHAMDALRHAVLGIRMARKEIG